VKDRNGKLHLLVMAGDGIGPEIVAATLDILKVVDRRFGIGLCCETAQIGLVALKHCGTTFPDEVLAQARTVDGIVLGPVSHNEYPPMAKGGLNPSGELRKHLDLYANIRPARTRAGLLPRCGKPLDLVIVRENTEGFYADRTFFLGPGEFMPTPDLAIAMRKVTRQGSLRIAESAFSLARTRRRKVTAVHKANVLRVSDGFFLDCVREVAKGFPEVVYEERLVDSMAAQLVKDACGFDVIVTTNMFGDILSDLAAEISGSLGIAASLNTGTNHALAQAQHGSAPDIANRNIANPSSLIGSVAMLLDWLALRHQREDLLAAAAAIEQALDRALEKPETRTGDLGGALTTTDFTRVVAGFLA